MIMSCVTVYSQQLGSSQLWAPPVPTTLVSGLGAETSTGPRLMVTMILSTLTWWQWWDLGWQWWDLDSRFQEGDEA